MIYKGMVAYNRRISEGVFHMKISLPRSFSARPAQFINILVSGEYTPLLRRPFSIFDCSARSVEIVYKVIGQATEMLSIKKKGEKIEFTGPLGNSYLDFFESETGSQKPEIILVGGGTGIASIHFLAKELKRKKIRFTAIQGARSGKNIIYKEKFRKLKCIFTTEDGSCGTKGFVTKALKKESAGSRIIFACGPKGMIKAIRDSVKKNPKKSRKKLNTGSQAVLFASFEEYMGCGIGACLSCVIPVKIKGDKDFIYKRVCADGTVFNVKDVVL